MYCTVGLCKCLGVSIEIIISEFISLKNYHHELSSEDNYYKLLINRLKTVFSDHNFIRQQYKANHDCMLKYTIVF